MRAKLAGRSRAYGVFCEVPAPEAVEIAGIAGWDFVIIDCEHAPITAHSLPAMVRAAETAGIAAVVRVASNEESAIQHALDAGAAGVQIPQIASVEAARKAIQAARFHPLGKRGLNPFVRAAKFSAMPVGDFLRRSNEEVALILQIESAEGIAAAADILELDGVDVLFVGPYDLSQSLGDPGDVSNPRVFEAGAALAGRAEARGVAVGVFANTEDDARRWLEAGVRYLCYSVDSVILLNAMRQAAASIRGLCPPRS